MMNSKCTLWCTILRVMLVNLIQAHTVSLSSFEVIYPVTPSIALHLFQFPLLIDTSLSA